MKLNFFRKKFGNFFYLNTHKKFNFILVHLKEDEHFHNFYWDLDTKVLNF